jgi:hypothetical protein
METMFNSETNEQSTNENTTMPENIGLNSGDLPNPEDIHNHISGLMNGKLGRLAQDIAEETAKDIGSDLGDIKSADQIFHKLFKNPGKLMSLVKKVGNRLEEKIKSGEIKESELLKEASEFMTKMKDMPGMGNMKNVLGQMGMSGLGKDMKVNMGALNGMMRGAQARDRLRAKLAKKNEERAKAGHSVATSKFSTGEKVEKSIRKPTNDNNLVSSQNDTLVNDNLDNLDNNEIVKEEVSQTTNNVAQKKKNNKKKKNKNRKK